jgi:hypothetical protein
MMMIERAPDGSQPDPRSEGALVSSGAKGLRHFCPAPHRGQSIPTDHTRATSWPRPGRRRVSCSSGAAAATRTSAPAPPTRGGKALGAELAILVPINLRRARKGMVMAEQRHTVAAVCAWPRAGANFDPQNEGALRWFARTHFTSLSGQMAPTSRSLREAAAQCTSSRARA